MRRFPYPIAWATPPFVLVVLALCVAAIGAERLFRALAWVAEWLGEALFDLAAGDYEQ